MDNCNSIKILHLSDIHLGTTEQANSYFTQLATDLTQNLKIEQLNYLVLSGDIGNYSTIDEYDAAFELVNKLLNHYRLDSNRVIIVPGNHDLNWDLSESAYDFVAKRKLPKSLAEGQYIDAGDAGKLIRDEERYKQRFKYFSKHFYEKIRECSYPLEYDKQSIIYPFPEDKILFLTLNSCWEIDQHYKDRSSINSNSISNSIDQILTGNYDDWLKIAIWHHPVTSAESMKNVAFLEQLVVNGFQIAMHGHIHEAKDENFQYDNNRGLRIIAAGTFGAPAREQVTGIPLQYNLLILDPDNRELTVETRKKEKVDGAWSADARWGDKNNPSPRYVVSLNSDDIDAEKKTTNPEKYLKNKTNPSIFISYCHEDSDHNIIDYTIQQITDKLKKKIDIYFDKNLNFGDDINKFIALLNKVDVAIIFATPTYKKKIDKKGGWAYEEFKLILERLENFEDVRGSVTSSEIANFKIIPIILSGSLTSSLPTELSSLIFCDLSDVRISKKEGKYIISNTAKNKINPYLNKMVEILSTISLQNSKSFQQTEADFNDQLKIGAGLFGKLFINTKFSSSTIEKVPPFYEKLFVRTPDFNEVVQQNSYFIIGRKGSGKSTITGALAMLSDQKYKGFIAISAESINLIYLYDSMTNQTNADQNYILSRYTFFQVAWDGFIVLCLIKLIFELSKKNVLSEPQKLHAPHILNFYLSFMNGAIPGIDNDENVQTFLFEAAFDKAQFFLNSIINNSPSPDNSVSTLRSISQASFNSKTYLNNLLGSETYEALVKIIELCDKRVLVTVDNFDTKFDLLRREALTNGAELLKRHNFETDWLHGIMLRVLDLKDLNGARNTPFSSMDFCLTIPKDRFILIEKSDRDAYRFDNRLKNIRWTGLDLCKLLIQRLSFLTNSKPNTNLKLHLQLEELFKKHFPLLPFNLELKHNESSVEIPLFCYVLRHSFWRPRDILKIFSTLLAASKTYIGTAPKIPVSTIKTLVNDAAYTIIKTEFTDEYNSTIPKIKEIVNSFHGKSQILTTEEIRIHLSMIQNLFVLLNDEDNNLIRNPENFDFKRQIELLFDIGFLGIVFLKNENTIYTRHMEDEFPDHFYFNEGSRAFHRVADADFKEAKFIIHPIFWDNLLLNPYKNYFSQNYTWEYLYNNGSVVPYRA
jgi:predicted MPP superfamily phosphohydrolase/energy-coupling factor transporter ATP-binding protein EcfA2